MWTYVLVVTVAVLLPTVRPERDLRTPPGSGVEQTLLRFGDQVRVQAPALGRGWVNGVVGDVNGCMVILVPTEDEGGRATAYRPVPVNDITAAQRQRPSAAGSKAAWIDLPIADVRRRHGGCTLPGW